MKRFIHIDAVKIGTNRQRRTFEASKMQEFSDGIAKRGLLHPIVLRVVGDDFVLVAGERRLRAIKDIYGLGGRFSHDGEQVPDQMIPYTLLSDLDELDAEEAELEENIHREDLTWQERAAAHARINALRLRQAEARGDNPPTVAAIALEVRGSSEGVNHETTRRELIVARHLDKPEIKAAKTVDEAFKLLKKAEATEKARTLGESVGRTFTADMHQLFNEDCVPWLARCTDESFDVILTDPPYGMGADSFGDSGGLAAGAHGYKDDEETFRRVIEALKTHAFRITKPQAHLYCFCDIEAFGFIKDQLAEAGWSVFRTPLIWYKKSGMRAPWPDCGPQRKYETILYAVKGKRPVLKMGGDVLEFVADANLGHAAQKPVALFEELLSRSCLPGNTALDICGGSGPLIPAAHARKVLATVIELDQASYGLAVKRLEDIRKQPDLLEGM